MHPSHRLLALPIIGCRVSVMYPDSAWPPLALVRLTCTEQSILPSAPNRPRRDMAFFLFFFPPHTYFTATPGPGVFHHTLGRFATERETNKCMRERPGAFRCGGFGREQPRSLCTLPPKSQFQAPDSVLRLFLCRWSESRGLALAHRDAVLGSIFVMVPISSIPTPLPPLLRRNTGLFCLLVVKRSVSEDHVR